MDEVAAVSRARAVTRVSRFRRTLGVERDARRARLRPRRRVLGAGDPGRKKLNLGNVARRERRWARRRSNRSRPGRRVPADNGLNKLRIDKCGFQIVAEGFEDFPSLASSFSAFGTLSAVRGALTAAGPEPAVSRALVRMLGETGTRPAESGRWCCVRFEPRRLAPFPKFARGWNTPWTSTLSFTRPARSSRRSPGCPYVRRDDDDASFATPPALVDRMLDRAVGQLGGPLTHYGELEVHMRLKRWTDLFCRRTTHGARGFAASRTGRLDKGRYVPRRARSELGARKLLDIRPNLLEESLDAMRDDIRVLRTRMRRSKSSIGFGEITGRDGGGGAQFGGGGWLGNRARDPGTTVWRALGHR